MLGRVMDLRTSCVVTPSSSWLKPANSSLMYTSRGRNTGANLSRMNSK
jgi:hypothetical protein